jgi:DNA-binding FrmR family transcriptional regulator
MAVVRDEQHKKDLILRLRRIEGQLRGIQAMIEKDAECESIVQQLSASRRALDKAFFNMLACAIQSDAHGAESSKAASKQIEHAAALLAKFG